MTPPKTKPAPALDSRLVQRILAEIKEEEIVAMSCDVINIPSPTGDTDWAISFVENELSVFEVPNQRTNKGALIASLEGIRSDLPRGVSAHVDTLGAMVKEIKPSGRLKLTALNGVMWPSVESEGVWVATRSGRQVRGSIVLANGAAHVNKEARTAGRDETSLEVRLDERTASAEETRVLGIEVGDYVYFDPRVETAASGYIRSRFLDDKASVACILAALKAIREAGVTAAQRATVQGVFRALERDIPLPEALVARCVSAMARAARDMEDSDRVAGANGGCIGERDADVSNPGLCRAGSCASQRAGSA